MTPFQPPRMIKSCLQEYWDHFEEEFPPSGSWAKSELKRVSFLIAMELRRLGYSEVDAQYEFRIWIEQRCNVKISPQDADSHVFGTVTWVYKQSPRELGCSKDGLLVQGGYCFIAYRPCSYDRKYNQSKIISKRLQNPGAYSDFGWPGYLQRTYKSGRLMHEVYIQILIAYFDSPFKAVCIGMEKISRLILVNTKEFKLLHPKQIARAVHVLVNEGLIFISERGMPGKNNGRANCYIVVDPPPPCPGKLLNKNG